MDSKAITLPDGDVAIIGMISAWDYFNSFLPLMSQLELRLQTLGDWAALIVDELGWSLIGKVIALIPRLDVNQKLSIDMFGDEWSIATELLSFTIPHMYSLPDLHFKQLSRRKNESEGSGDPLADLLSSCVESMGIDAAKSLDVVTIHRMQWQANQAAYNSLPLEKKQELEFQSELDEIAELKKKRFKAMGIS